MAYLFADGFDGYSAASDITQRWDSVSGAPSLVAAASTAFSVGGAVSLSSAVNLSKTLSSNESTIYFSLRRKQTGGSSASLFSYVQLIDSATAQLTIRWNEDGSLGAYSGASGGTLIGSVASAVHSSASWDSWQIKVVIHNTTGSVEVRKNGSTTPVLNLTGINTRSGTANSYANKILLGVFTSSTAVQWDDFFIWSGSGAAPNTWAGDLRCITDAPSATVQSQWSKSPAAQTWGQTVSSSSSSALGTAAGTIAWFKIAAPFSGTASQIAISIATALTGTINAALYSDSSGVVGSLLAQSTGAVNPGAGTSTFTLGSTVAVTKGTSYWVAYWSNASTQSAATFNGAGSGLTRMTQTLTYTGTFPSTGAAAGSLSASANGPYLAIDLTSLDAFSLVNDATQDADTSYVYSATAGQEDLYSFPTLASQGVTPVSIIGVLPFAVLKKSDSGSRTVSVRAKSGAVDTAAATNAAPGLTYAFLGGFLATDPNTSATWATAAVDAMNAGVKVDA